MRLFREAAWQRYLRQLLALQLLMLQARLLQSEGVIYRKVLPSRPDAVNGMRCRFRCRVGRGEVGVRMVGSTEAGSSFVAGCIYAIAFLTGGIVMSFEMLGSRYLNPYFGSGIYT